MAKAPGQTPPWPFIDSASFSATHPCAGDVEKEKRECKSSPDPCSTLGLTSKPKGKAAADAMVGKFKSNLRKPAGPNQSDTDSAKRCLAARRCKLVPKSPKKGEPGCCPGQTGHHLVPGAAMKAFPKYDYGAAPTVCAEGTGHSGGTHGQCHAIQGHLEFKAMQAGRGITLGEYQKSAGKVVNAVFLSSACNPACVESQLKKYHEKEAGVPATTPLPLRQPSKKTLEQIKKLCSWFVGLNK